MSFDLFDDELLDFFFFFVDTDDDTDMSSQEQLLSLTEELLLDKDLLAFEWCEEDAFSSFEDAAGLLLAFFDDDDGLEVIELLDGPISVFCLKMAFFVGFM